MREESHIAEGWGLDKSNMDGLRRKDKVCRPSSLKFWSPPPLQVFKLNFNGASIGNPGPADYGGVYRDSTGKTIKLYYGSNNSGILMNYLG